MTNILSIDGGGIRGVIPATILMNLENKIKEKSGDDTKTIADYFDLIAGTSAGGLISLTLITPDSTTERAKYSAKDMLDVYLQRGNDMFNVDFWRKSTRADFMSNENFSNEGLKNVLNDLFGDLYLSELLKPSLITAYNVCNNKGKFFNKMDAVKDPKHDFLVKDVAYSTVAAPTYFEHSQIKSKANKPLTLIDGGVFANNPTLCAYAEVRRQFYKHPTVKEMNILSIGTGYTKQTFNHKETQDWGLIKWAKPLLSIMMNGSALTVDYQVRQMYDAVNRPNHYLRIDSELHHADPDMSNATPENLEKLQEDAAEIVQQYDKQIDAFVEIMCPKNDILK